jgi:hypothetical protein
MLARGSRNLSHLSRPAVLCADISELEDGITDPLPSNVHFQSASLNALFRLSDVM